MDASEQRSASGIGWGVLAVIAVAALAGVLYLAVPELHGARMEANYPRVFAFINHHPSERAPATPIAEDRHMDPHFESDLRGFVPTSTSITVTVMSDDRETRAFAHEIAAWLRANGWQHVQGVSEHQRRELKPLTGTNLQIDPKGGMELVVGPRSDSAP